MSEQSVEFRTAATPADLSVEVVDELVDCWIEVGNAGGAVGFPFPPVGPAEVGPVAAEGPRHRAALVREARTVARNGMGVEQLRLSADDDRDEIMMVSVISGDRQGR